MLEVESEGNSEEEEEGTGRRVMWKGKEKGKKKKKYDDSFKQKWRNLMARMGEEGGGKEGVGMGGGFSVW